jgi:corin
LSKHCIIATLLIQNVYFYSLSNQPNLDGWTIQLGFTRRNAHSYFGQKMKVRRVVPHPMYDTGIANDNDVALFQVRKYK